LYFQNYSKFLNGIQVNPMLTVCNPRLKKSFGFDNFFLGIFRLHPKIESQFSVNPKWLSTLLED